MSNNDKKEAKKAPVSTDLPEKLSDIINTKLEEDQHLVNLANKEKVALIAFIASYVGVRITPSKEAYATIGLADEFSIEALIRELKSTNIKKAYLLVNSPGGGMDSSYKIARAIRTCVDEIITFVPHVAASGGTLLALTGNEIVMGPMSHITPMDVQISYKGAGISAATSMRFFARITEWFEKTPPDDAPYPQKALADKLDPFIMEEWNGLMNTAKDYVNEILDKAGYKEKASEITESLVVGYPSHGYVITTEKAKEMGLNVINSGEKQDTWDIMRYWLGKYMFQEQLTHCIRYVLPNHQKKMSEAKNKA